MVKENYPNESETMHYSSSVVCGFEFTIEPVTQKKTKYNQDTGEPYEAEEHSHDCIVIGGKRICENLDNPDAFCCGEKIEGLTISRSGYDHGTMVLGVKLSEVSDGDDHKTFPWSILPEEVEAFADKYNVVPGFHHLMRCG